jgi:hypothetical protein
LKLWIDDFRPAPEGYVWCKSVDEAKIMIEHLEDAFTTLGNLGRQIAGYGNLDGENYSKIITHWLFLEIELIDLDHDAGDFAQYGGDYIRILDWLEETNRDYPIRIHSQNPVGREDMRRIIERNGWEEIK